MNLTKKKELAAKVLGVGKGRIIFAAEGNEIKEAITRQDILDLHASGVIQVREVSGRKKIVKRKHKRRTGKVKKKVNTRKKDYVTITRKLRKFAKYLLKTKKVDKDDYKDVRRKIRARKFKSKRHLKETFEE